MEIQGDARPCKTFGCSVEFSFSEQSTCLESNSAQVLLVHLILLFFFAMNLRVEQREDKQRPGYLSI